MDTLVTPALVLHIGAGITGVLTGLVALSVRKGSRLHRMAGNVFFPAMLLMSVMATYLAAAVPGQSNNLLGGPFTIYMVSTAWATARGRERSVGLFEYGAFVVAALGAAALFVFALLGARTPVGSGPVYAIAAVAALAAGLDLKVILRGGISGVQRIARHVWRMCFGSFIATGSFFLGQQQVMPKFLHGSPVLFFLGFSPLLAMIFWLIRIRIGDRFKRGGAGVLNTA